jgi:pimeloyl-ACP methyl ester carboxylesterase
MGSAAGLAREISKTYGVLEPMQSKYSITKLIEELKAQIEANCTCPVILIGHSWGAWLAGLFAEAYPEITAKVILVGSGPLEEKYVHEIGERRKRNMNEKQRAEYDELTACLNSGEADDKDAKLSRLGALVGQADEYEAMESDLDSLASLPADGKMYGSIWPEAARLRETGELARKFGNIKCPITVVHGKMDPHPYAGVIEPLKDHGISLHIHILKKCGHTPWKEKYARDDFFATLLDEIKETISIG